MKRAFSLSVLFTALLALSGVCLAAGSGGFGGGTGSIDTSGASASPKQQAKDFHNMGLKFKRKALGAEEDLAAATDDEDRAEAKKEADENWKKALGAFIKAYQLNDQQYQSLNEMGYAFRKTGDYENAIRSYNSALKIKADFPEAIEYRAEAFLAIGQYDLVKESYMKLIDMDKDQAATLMVEMQKWATTKASDESAPIKDFVSWINERSKLAAFIGGKAKSWKDT